jgi:hypothetical protein
MSAIKVVNFEAGQKLLDRASKLLWDGFNLDGTLLDIYGTFDRDGYVVEDVTIAHTRISIFELLSSTQVAYLDSECNSKLPGWGEHQANLKADAYAMQHG